MSLPKKFRFRHKDTQTKYKAEVKDDGVHVSWKNALNDEARSTVFSLANAEAAIAGGDWVVKPAYRKEFYVKNRNTGDVYFLKYSKRLGFWRLWYFDTSVRHIKEGFCQYTQAVLDSNLKANDNSKAPWEMYVPA